MVAGSSGDWIGNYFYCKVTKIFVNRSNLLQLNIYDTITRYSSPSPTLSDGLMFFSSWQEDATY